MDRDSKSIIDWTEEDFRAEGMLTRKHIAANGHPLIQPGLCYHSWDLDQEDAVLYLYCIWCQQTHVLSPNEPKRKTLREENPIHMYGVRF